MIWVLIVLIALLIAPFVREQLRRPMNEAARADAPGRFAKLPQGTTHYEWFGPSRGPVIVLIHGLTTPSFVWRGMTRGLAASGYRVLIYDLFGRGYSDRPAGRQNAAFFNRQLNDLLAHENVGDDITIVGYSMGGAVATCFAAAAPERIRQVVLLAPAGMHQLGDSTVKFIRDTPFLGDWVMRVFYPSVLRKGIRAEQGQFSSVKDIGKLQLAELKQRGFLPAVLSSLRGILSNTLDEEHQLLSERGVRVLAIWGRQDNLIPMTAAGTLATWNHDAHQEVIEDGGHAITYSHSEEVLGFMRGWMMPPPYAGVH